MKIRFLSLIFLIILFSLEVKAQGGAGALRPEVPKKQVPGNIQPMDLKPRVGGGGEADGCFSIDGEGTVRPECPDQVGGDKCWGMNQVQGLNGPLVCCPDDLMRNLRQKQKLQCLQAGQNPRELTHDELSKLHFNNGRPVIDEAADCKPFVCDQKCDEQENPGAPPKPGMRQRDKWAMDGEDDTKFGSNATDKADQDAKKEIADRAQEALEAKKEELKAPEEAQRKASLDLNRAKNEKAAADAEMRRIKSGSARPSDNYANAKSRADAANTKIANLEKSKPALDAVVNGIKDTIKKLEDWIKKYGGAGMPNPDGNNLHWREEYCAIHPNNCPELKRFKELGLGRKVDNWRINPAPEDAGGGSLPPNDDGPSQFLCLNQGGFPPAGVGVGGQQQENCPPRRAEGRDAGGMFGNPGAEEEREMNCPQGMPGIPLPGDDVVNPGDPTFFQCPEMGCPQQRSSSITMNNCPQNSPVGLRARMSCNPFNGPQGAIDPVRD